MPGKNYPQEVWTTIQALFESGNFTSLQELHKHCTKLLSKCPSLDAIKKRAIDWDKHALDEKKTEEKSKNFVELFAQLGMDEKRRAEIIVDGINAGSELEKEAADALIKANFNEDDPNYKAILAKLKVFYRTRATYLDMAHKLTGDYSPEKRKIVVKEGDLQKAPATKYKDMTDDELEERLARLKARRGVTK